MGDGPRISIDQSSVSKTAEAGIWRITWTIVNQSSGSLSVLSARLPHGQFRADERRFEPPLRLDSGEDAQFHALVRCDEPAGPVTENAFIIFRVSWSAEPWRIFVRVRVVVRASGEPETTVELITTQRVGFTEQR